MDTLWSAKISQRNTMMTCEIKAYIKKREQENRIREKLINAAVYFVFVWALYVVAFSKIDLNAYRYQGSLQNLFGVKKYDSLDSFGQVNA